MTWQILVTISVFTYAISVLLQRILLKDDKSDPIAYSIVFQLVTGLLIGIYAVWQGFSIPDLRPVLLNLALMTIFYGTGNVLIFNALKLIEASEFTILFASRALWTIFAAVLFLGEKFSFQQGLGTLLIISSVIFVSYKSQKIKFGKGEIFAILAAITFGLAFANDAFIIRNFDVPSYLTIAFIVPALAVWAVYPKSTGKMKPFLEKTTLLKLGLLGVFYAVSAITIFLAYQVGRNAAQIAPLNQTATIITVILAIIFLNERSNLARKIIGAAGSFIGVVLVG